MSLVMEAKTILKDNSLSEAKQIKVSVNDREFNKLPVIKTLEQVFTKIAFIRDNGDRERYQEAIKTISNKVLDAYKEIENLSLESALKNESINESVSVTGIKDIQELYPDIYEMIKNVPNIENASEYQVELRKLQDGSFAASISAFLIAGDSRNVARLDIEKLAEVIKNLKENENVRDVYYVDYGKVIIEIQP